MTSPTVLSHRAIYLRPRAARMPPNSMALLALAELPIYVSNGVRAVSDATPCALRTVSESPTALQHSRIRTVIDITEATVGESTGEAARALGPQLRSACLFLGRLPSVS